MYSPASQFIWARPSNSAMFDFFQSSLQLRVFVSAREFSLSRRGIPSPTRCDGHLEAAWGARHLLTPRALGGTNKELELPKWEYHSGETGDCIHVHNFRVAATQEKKSSSGDVASAVRQQGWAFALGQGSSLALIPRSAEKSGTC